MADLEEEAQLDAPANTAETPDVETISENDTVDAVAETSVVEPENTDDTPDAETSVDGSESGGDAVGAHLDASVDAATWDVDPISVDDVPAADAPEEPASTELTKKLSLPIVIGIAIAALVVGLLVGMFALGGSGSSAATGKTTLGEADLKAPMATYTYKGTSGTVTVGDVIEESSSLEAAATDEGAYAVPTADTALGVVRNKILVGEAEAQGITVTDEDVAAYAASTLGTDDFEAIASSYGMDAGAVKTLLRESCLMGKLRDSIVTAQDVAMPEPPEAPASDDDANKATKAYADYIIALAGDEWDAKKDTWASDDGPYASSLSGMYDISSKGATYEAATAAYYIAYQLYATEQSAVDAQWTDYVNGILSNATIHIYTLLA